MFWQKIKSTAQWLMNKIAAVLWWIGIKLGVIAPSSPVIDMSVPAKTRFLHQQQSESSVATAQQYLSLSASSSSSETKRFIPGQVFSYRELPWDILFNIRTFLHPRDFANNNQVLGHLLYPREALEKKVEANSYSQLRQFIVGNKLTQLLNSVEHADYEQVEKIIADEPALMFGHVNYKFRDGSRECISPLQCAFKLYDTYMWKIFYERIRREANPNLQQEYVKRYIKQMQEQTTHIDLEPLFEAYTEYERQYQLWVDDEITNEKLDEEWFKLGTVQKRMLPIHILKEFSREGYTWSASSSFDVNVTPRPANCRVFDCIADVWKSLSSTLSDPGWGASFSLIRAEYRRRLASGSRGRVAFYQVTGLVGLDLAAFRRLFEVRREDFARQLALIGQNPFAGQEQQNPSVVVTTNSSRVAS